MVDLDAFLPIAQNIIRPELYLHESSQLSSSFHLCSFGFLPSLYRQRLAFAAGDSDCALVLIFTLGNAFARVSVGQFQFPKSVCLMASFFTFIGLAWL